MKALILAAGEGKRLRPLTDDRPKCMVPFRGRPLIDYTLDAMQACGLRDIALVHGYCHPVLESHLQTRNVTFFHNPAYDRTNMVHSLFCAESWLDDDLIISYSDILYTAPVLQALMDCAAPVSVVIDRDWRALWEQRFADPLSDAETLKLDVEGHIRELGKKPKSYDEIEGQYIGLIKISRDALPTVRDFYRCLDRAATYDGKSFENMFMTSFIQLVIDNLLPVKAVEIHGGWLEVDTLDDLSAYESAPVIS